MLTVLLVPYQISWQWHTQAATLHRDVPGGRQQRTHVTFATALASQPCSQSQPIPQVLLCTHAARVAAAAPAHADTCRVQTMMRGIGHIWACAAKPAGAAAADVSVRPAFKTSEHTAMQHVLQNTVVRVIDQSPAPDASASGPGQARPSSELLPRAQTFAETRYQPLVTDLAKASAPFRTPSRFAVCPYCQKGSISGPSRRWAS